MASYGSKLAIKINYVWYYFYLQTNYLVSYQNLKYCCVLQRHFLKFETIYLRHFDLQASFLENNQCPYNVEYV